MFIYVYVFMYSLICCGFFDCFFILCYFDLSSFSVLFDLV